MPLIAPPYAIQMTPGGGLTDALVFGMIAGNQCATAAVVAGARHKEM